MNEREFIRKFESADPGQLAGILQDATLEEERALRAYLGEERYRRMRAISSRVGAKRRGPAGAEQRGNVVVLPGIMGSELTAVHGGRQTQIWLNYFRIATGWLNRLRLDDAGNPFETGFEVRASGVLNKYYGELLLQLTSEGWNVRPFWYDWRKSLSDAAADLDTFISRQFADRDVRIIAHSMGGLVARTLLHQRLTSGDFQRQNQISRLIMLGTPNGGSYEIAKVLTGTQQTVRLLGRALAIAQFSGLARAIGTLLDTLNSFPGTYQMLPFDPQGPDAALVERLYQPETYAALASDYPIPIMRRHLEAARLHHEQVLSQVQRPELLTYVAGSGVETASELSPGGVSMLHLPAAYTTSMAGDGMVPHRLGLLEGVRTYYVAEPHGTLPSNLNILGALDKLLNGRDADLPTSPAAVRLSGVRRGPPQTAAETQRVEEQFEDLVRRLEAHQRRLTCPPARHLKRRNAAEVPKECEQHLEKVRLAMRSATADAPPPTGDTLSPDENRAEQLLLGGFLGGPLAAPAAGSSSEAEAMPTQRGKIELRLVPGRIQDVPGSGGPELSDIDIIAVGTYIDSQPSGTLRALDRAIRDTTGRRIFRDLHERGLLRGPLGQLFLVPDPRDPKARAIAACSMGIAGSFGKPELVVLARQLVLSVSILGYKHLATTLIGAGWNKMSPRDAADGWLRGIVQAVRELSATSGPQLRRLTFIERDDHRARMADDAICTVAKRVERDLDVEYRPLVSVAEKIVLAATSNYDEEQENPSARLSSKSLQVKPRCQSSRRREESADAVQPTRVTVSRVDHRWSFSAMTQDAAVPERVIEMDPDLVAESATVLAGESSLEAQLKYGTTLESFLIPRDLRDHFYSEEPLVMIVDATTARVPWEMMVQPFAEVRYSRDMVRRRAQEDPSYFEPDLFVGTARGLTRQLRTQFAQPPEPSPTTRDVLHVLVVADPSRKHPLPGARREGLEVAALFRSLNELGWGGKRIEVKTLIGPLEATRLEVMAEVLNRRYDVLHFCGHCFFDPEDPPSSGWIFDSGILSARELTRIDLAPSFVFSNACESGITPERPECFSPALAPSFAESFFRQGVTNFVCTGWPVDDEAAREFALSLYEQLLGIRRGEGRLAADPGGSADMASAMQAARVRIASTLSGRSTWGAYQHYGNPLFRLYRGGWQSSGVHSVPFNMPPVAPQETLPEDAADELAGTDNTDDPRFVAVEAAIRQHGPSLLQRPDVAAVKAGYVLDDNGWPGDEPAVVVHLMPGAARATLPATLAVGIDRQSRAVPVTAAPASAAQQVLKLSTTAAERQVALEWLRSQTGDDSVLSELAQLPTDSAIASRKATEAYMPPDMPLREVSEKMTLICNNSPGDSWSVLSDFIDATKTRLTVAIYDFTADYILERLRSAVKKSPRRLDLVICPKTPRGAGETESEFRDSLRATLKQRLDFSWAPVKVGGKTKGGVFNNSYHIKVTVRDGKAVWLSSGNWQPQNLPEEDLDENSSLADIRRTNREWHVVAESPKLAAIFETYIQHDLATGKRFEAETRSLGAELPFSLLIQDETEFEDLTRVAPQVFGSQTFGPRTFKIQPLLTPDNYAEKIAELIASAEEKMYLQNQYLKPESVMKIAASDPDGDRKRRFLAVCDAVRDCIRRKLDVKIILRRGDDAAMLADLKRFGISDKFIQLQDRCHNKGIIVDSKKVAIGSHNLSLDGATNNRDATLIIHDEEVAQYYEQVFLYDWKNLSKRKGPVTTVVRRDDRQGVRSALRVPADGTFREADWSELFG